jgi:CcmD family protein
MKNLGSVLTAYMVGWAVFFFYFVSVARRTANLRREVERLKESLGRPGNRTAGETVSKGR